VSDTRALTLRSDDVLQQGKQCHELEKERVKLAKRDRKARTQVVQPPAQLSLCRVRVHLTLDSLNKIIIRDELLKFFQQFLKQFPRPWQGFSHCKLLVVA